MTRRIIAVSAIAVAVGLGAAACGSTSAPAATSPGATITLSFLSYNYGTPDLGGQGTAELISAFEAANPAIKIKPQGVPVADALTEAQAETAAGDPPDVARIGWSKMAAAYRDLPVTPVQDIPSAAQWQAATAGMSQPLLTAVAESGKVVATPYTISTPTLFYNATLFKQAGLNPADPPATVAAAQRDGLAITRTGAYFDIAGAAKSDFLTQSIIDANGGSEISASGQPDVDQPAAVAALAAMRELTTSGAQPAVSEADAIAAFDAGKLGMLVTSTALLSGVESAAQGKFDLRTAAMPGFAGKPAHTTFSGAGLVVLAKDKAHQQAAWQFIKFLTSAEGFTIITSKIGYLPLRPDIVNDPRYLGPYYRKDPRIGPALKQLDEVTPYAFFSGAQAAQAVATLRVPQLSGCAVPLLLLRQQVREIPASLTEAATLDGANNWQALWHVVLPVMRPALAAVAILVFAGTWNEYLWPLIAAPAGTPGTIQTGLALFLNTEGASPGPLLAAATLATPPVLAAYACSARPVTSAFMHSGIG